MPVLSSGNLPGAILGFRTSPLCWCTAVLAPVGKPQAPLPTHLAAEGAVDKQRLHSAGRNPQQAGAPLLLQLTLAPPPALGLARRPQQLWRPLMHRPAVLHCRHHSSHVRARQAQLCQQGAACRELPAGAWRRAETRKVAWATRVLSLRARDTGAGQGWGGFAACAGECSSLMPSLLEQACTACRWHSDKQGSGYPSLAIAYG